MIRFSIKTLICASIVDRRYCNFGKVLDGPVARRPYVCVDIYVILGWSSIKVMRSHMISVPLY